MKDKWFETLIERLKACNQVEALALGGSRARGNNDSASDYDLYIYLEAELPVSTRHKIEDDLCSYTEINNQFWETEDDNILNSRIPIDMVYRDLATLKDQIEAALHGQANCGYSTCMVENIRISKILYDKHGRLQALQKESQADYPEILRQNIVDKNRRLLSGSLASYDGQLEKAVKRQDLPSISHRTAAFIESYFDILFALNRKWHPGEKRMMEHLQDQELLPSNFQDNLKILFASQYQDSDTFLKQLHLIIESLDELLVKEGFSIPNSVPSVEV